MYRQDTVFILGAGGSWHYGYPTGEGLITRVAEKSNQLADAAEALRAYDEKPRCVRDGKFTNQSVGLGNGFIAWDLFAQAAKDLAKRIETVRPLVIDYFLAQNDDLQLIGKFIITWVILECEIDYRSGSGNPNRLKIYTDSPFEEIRSRGKGLHLEKFQDDWYKFVIDGIISSCRYSAELLENRMNIITFNYDVSIESHIYSRLNNISLFAKSDIENFLSEDRVLHIYGRVRHFKDAILNFDKNHIDRLRSRNPTINSDYINMLRSFINFFDFVYDSSRSIQTIGNNEKNHNSNILSTARKLIKSARHIYIIGYGFDQNNNDRIGLDAAVTAGKKNIMFTNYNDSNVINKRVSTLFFKTPEKFISNNIAISHYGSRCEKSVRDAFGALDQDFFHYEEDLE